MNSSDKKFHCNWHIVLSKGSTLFDHNNSILQNHCGLQHGNTHIDLKQAEKSKYFKY